MSDMSYTKEQLRAIESSGHNILVSASAGSGKTTVLIERILYQLKKGRNIDELLIVTYTELAANQLKQRLRKKLNQEIKNNPNPHLRKQITHLASAEISTFHSFCNRVIKRFFYLIDADAKYKISEDIETYLISEDVFENLFNELFEIGDEDFLYIVSRFQNRFNDEELKTLLMDLYNKLRTIPFPQDFIQKTLGFYEFSDLSSWALYPLLKKEVLANLEEAANAFKNAYDLTLNTEHPYQEQYKEDEAIVSRLRELIHKGSYDEVYYYLKQDSLFNRFKSPKEMDGELKLMIKSFRDQGKKLIEEGLKKYYLYQESSQIKFMQENKNILEKLFHLTNEFEKRFSSAKKEQNLVDFSDLEIMALKILSLDNYQNEATHYYRNLFKEILVDEFQDTNSMQETIIRSVSNGNNIFMVGDVKQSIYRFRNAEPEIFQGKYKDYQLNNGSGELINLNANYRSREEVIDFINYLFVQLMDEEVGEIIYDEAAHLRFGQKEYQKDHINEKFVQLHILDQAKINEKMEEKNKKADLEAHYVAQKIKQLISEGELIYDKGLRPITYRDIVILSRTKKDMDTYHEVFKKYNIPFLSTDLSGYFDSIEVSTVISILKIIDNPMQDIPLLATLRTPLFNVNEKELIQLKVIGNANSYYDKIQLYLKKGSNDELNEKLSYFIECLTKWREMSKRLALSELIFDIYHHTNYYDFVLGQVGGKQRQANLDLLYDRAKQYEDMTSNSLFRFIQLINFLDDNDKDLQQARTVSDNEDLVQFMSIHGSKGLEFPVVFITNLSKQYNTRDEKGNLLFDKELGIGFGYKDLTYQVKYNTLYQLLLKDKLRNKTLSEEMRLLYVALTRAKERIYLIGTSKDLPKEVGECMQVSYDEILLPQSERLRMNYLSLIYLALARHSLFREKMDHHVERKLMLNEPQCEICVVDELDLSLEGEDHDDILELDFSKYAKEFSNRLQYKYPYLEKTNHYAKQTIADMKKAIHFSESNYQPGPIQLKTPQFADHSKKDRTLRGTIYHVFMQHIDYKKEYTLDDLEKLRQQLIVKEIFSEETASLIHLPKVLNYLQTELVQTFKKAKKVYQELPFTTLVSSQNVYHDLKDEFEVLIQGVMDLYVYCDDIAYLIDFKTDYLEDTEQAILKVKKEYQIQLSIYKDALQKMVPHKMVLAYLYLFEINKFIQIDI